MRLKHVFKELFSFITLPVSSGPLRGLRLSVTSGGKFLSGRHEPYKTDALIKNFSKGEIFYDIGAHIGYFSAIAAVLNKGEGKVISFEPRPMNARFFRRHMRINRLEKVVLYEAAVGEYEGEVFFDTSFGSATGMVSSAGDTAVKQVSADRLVREGKIPPPTFVKIDVEGGEIEVLKGLRDIIKSSRPKILVATHNDDCHTYVVDFLKVNGYRFEILNPGRIKGDTEIIALPQ